MSDKYVSIYVCVWFSMHGEKYWRVYIGLGGGGWYRLVWGSQRGKMKAKKKKKIHKWTKYDISNVCLKLFEWGARILLICWYVCAILLSEKGKLQNNVYKSIFFIKNPVCVYMHVCLYEQSMDGYTAGC